MAADKKISELVELQHEDIEKDADLLAIVDDSATETKKIIASSFTDYSDITAMRSRYGDKPYFYFPSTGKVTVADDAEIQDIFATGGTVSTTANAFSDGQNDGGRIFGKGASLYVANETTGNVEIRFTVVFSGDNGLWKTGLILPINELDIITVTYDASNVANIPIIYLNGVSQSVTTTTPPTVAYTTDVGTDLFIGNSVASNRAWGGEIKELIFWPRILSPTEVLNYFKDGNILFSDLSTIAQFLPEGIAPSSWNNSNDDASIFGSIVATGSNTATKKIVDGHTFNYVRAGIANTATTLANAMPPKYKITGIRLKATGAITAVKIGISSGGEQIVASVAASATPTLAVLEATANDTYSESAYDSIFVEHATAVETLEVIIKFERVS